MPGPYIRPMTATQIIAEISALPQQEKQQVIRFTRRLEAELPLAADDLTVLAERLVAADDAGQASALRDQIMKGFYGTK